MKTIEADWRNASELISDLVCSARIIGDILDLQEKNIDLQKVYNKIACLVVLVRKELVIIKHLRQLKLFYLWMVLSLQEVRRMIHYEKYVR